MVCALACEHDLELCHFDIDQAFVRADLAEDVYMRLPEGCGSLSGKVVKLSKSLYGLKQASRQWYAILSKCLSALGFVQCLADSCGFRLAEGREVAMHLVVHGDDNLAVGKKERCGQFGKDLGRHVPVKSLGELKWYSGCYYERDREAGRLTISQQTYTEEFGEKYGVEWGNAIPIPTTWRLWDFDVDEPNVLFPFRELIGALSWIALLIRPDIANSVRAVARYCSAPKLMRWNAARSILGYAMRTSSFGISFQKGTLTVISLVSFADADYASRSTDRRSVSGGVVMCAGGAVSWYSKSQKCVTLSTTQAGYVAMSDMGKEILFLRQVWCFMLLKARMPCIAMYEDNEGAIQVAKHPILNSNSKHIDVRHHFLRELVERKEVEIIHVASQYQHADFLTKALPEREVEFHRGIVTNLM